jgi:hypothetical protein
MTWAKLRVIIPVLYYFLPSTRILSFCQKLLAFVKFHNLIPAYFHISMNSPCSFCNQIQFSSLGSQHQCSIPLTGSRDRHLRDLVTAYTKKQMTQRQDKLNGISGILEELSRSVGPFFHSIPLACFSNAKLVVGWMDVPCSIRKIFR